MNVPPDGGPAERGNRSCVSRVARSSTFIPLWHYLLENKALDLLLARGRQVFVHTVITGGQALGDTLNGFDQLAQTTVQVKQEGASFQDMAVYKAHRDKTHGVVAVVRRNADTFGKDVARGFVLNG